MTERCDRCGAELPFDDGSERALLHVATYGQTDKPFKLGNGEELPAGSLYHGDSYYGLCPDCTRDWWQWFALFMGEGEFIAMYGRGNDGLPAD